MKKRLLTTLFVLGFTVLAGVSAKKVQASCAPHPVYQLWGNPDPNGYVQEIMLAGGGCSDNWIRGVGDSEWQKNDPPRKPEMFVKTVQRSWGWSVLESVSDEVFGNGTYRAMDIRYWQNATTTQYVELVPDGRLKVITIIDYAPEAGKDDVQMVDYLFNSARLFYERQRAFVCGLGCVFGEDVHHVNYILWLADGTILAKNAQSTVYCAAGGDLSCLPVPVNWLKIEANIILKDGTVKEFGWTRSQMPNWLKGYYAWVYKQYTFSDQSTANSQFSGENEQPNSENNQSQASNAVKREAPTSATSQITLPASSPGCQRPDIVAFYAGPAPEESTASFRLHYTVQGADRVEIFGNILEQHSGTFDVWIDNEDTTHWVIWAKVSGTPDDCYVEEGLYVTPGEVVSSS